MRAFVLGAGLGTRLRPLTEHRPKPLVPIYGKPLIALGFDHLLANGVTAIAVNTHHCPEAYGRILCGGDYRGCPLVFRHEPTLLDTGGGIKNVEDLMGDEPFVVYNGDVLADFPLGPTIRRHRESGRIATLVLRSSGGPLHVQARDGRVTGIRGSFGGDPSYLFTGISILSPKIFRHIPGGEIVSIIPVYINLIRRGETIGAEIVDEGLWFDLGTREAYLAAHALLAPGGHTLSYAETGWPRPVCPGAHVAPDARLEGACSVGAGAAVGSGAVLRDTVLWEGAVVAPGSRLDRCVVREEQNAAGMAADTDF